jgi:hypothetical protein
MARIAMRHAVVATLISVALWGCATGPEWTAPPGCPPQTAVPVQPAVAAYANPIPIPIADPQCVWERVVEVVEDYFRIEHEEPVRMIGNEPTAGTITTVAEVSPTVFEPWRRDTVDPEQRLENTLQSMRRRAIVSVTPEKNGGGYAVGVQVFKELEDNRHPDRATAGAATLRYDDTLTRVENPIAGQPITKGWIPQGRDTSLEQYIIADLLSRCVPAGTPTVVRGQSEGRGTGDAGRGK